MPVLVCAVVVGNSFPVSESPQDADGGFNGKPIRAKADSHITVVAKASADALPLPLPPDKWGAARVSTELVVRDESQVLRSPPADGVRMHTRSRHTCATGHVSCPWRRRGRSETLCNWPLRDLDLGRPRRCCRLATWCCAVA